MLYYIQLNLPDIFYQSTYSQYYPNIQASAIYGNKHKVAAEALTKVMFSLVAKDMCGKIAEVLRGIDDTGQS